MIKIWLAATVLHRNIWPNNRLALPFGIGDPLISTCVQPSILHSVGCGFRIVVITLHNIWAGHADFTFFTWSQRITGFYVNHLGKEKDIYWQMAFRFWCLCCGSFGGDKPYLVYGKLVEILLFYYSICHWKRFTLAVLAKSYQMVNLGHEIVRVRKGQRNLKVVSCYCYYNKEIVCFVENLRLAYHI